MNWKLTSTLDLNLLYEEGYNEKQVFQLGGVSFMSYYEKPESVTKI